MKLWNLDESQFPSLIDEVPVKTLEKCCSLAINGKLCKVFIQDGKVPITPEKKHFVVKEPILNSFSLNNLLRVTFKGVKKSRQKSRL